ncbi:PREDICTED: aurora kinase A and ninein-interacting protein isoform X1 [Chinchilla lanigera]|uniref:aurora kinase A and ninein-interacting protein isoform X1 n=2 Tax=Chinchilla lanigera TaxID=34839 RepID=UPI00069832E7|nr:PREDICTED: aurora kinase A and ninein-interacting protein isoform X1 [Chinchilla lanigera]
MANLVKSFIFQIFCQSRFLRAGDLAHWCSACLTHLSTPGTKMLTLLPRERKPLSFPQRRIPSAGIKQTSIASFILWPGMKEVDNKRSASSHTESQTNKQSKKDATQLDCLIQDLDNDCIASPLATSTPEDIQETGLSPKSHKTSGHHSVRNPFLTMLSLPQPNTLACSGKSKAPLALSSTQDLESSCLLDQKEDSPRKREWFYGSEKSYQVMERHIKPPGDKCHQLLDKAKSERKVSAKENGQPSVRLQTCRESLSRENAESVKQNPCLVSVFSWDSDKNDKESWSQLFTEDSQGQRVIAHNTRAPFQDVSNTWHQGLGHFPAKPWAECQAEHTQLNLQPDLLLTQDSEGNQVIRHQF